MLEILPSVTLKETPAIASASSPSKSTTCTVSCSVAVREGCVSFANKGQCVLSYYSSLYCFTHIFYWFIPGEV